MKYQIHNFLKKEYPDVNFDVSYPPEGLGDYSTNIAFLLAKEKKEDPQKIAGKIIEKISTHGESVVGRKNEFEKIEIARNGFINFYLSRDYLLEHLKDFLKDKIKFPKPASEKINIEFVSANPTGPLTLGNARSAAYGDSLANILKKTGRKVTREYYINDIGKQIEVLAESVKRRLQQLEGEDVEFPEEFYQGDYITELAREIKEKKVPLEQIREFAVKRNLEQIKYSLVNFGVKFDVWFNESTLMESKEINGILNYLDSAGLTYKKDGALWFKASQFGLDKDIVLIKSNGQGTYLLSDFAYAKNKISRGFDFNIYILGADHHDDVKRLKAGVKALGLDEEKFVVLLHQLVALKRGEEILRMTKRKGVYVTLDDLLKQIPKDVARYFFLVKSLDTHLEFDLELAKQESSKNPAYYIQYAFARINSVFEKAKSQKLQITDKNFELIKEKEELDLIKYLIRFPEVIFEISQNYQVHHLPQYALELANRFHRFYEKQRIISEDEKLTGARLALVKAVYFILGESLNLMGLGMPKRM
jgi:arginyl-tRNA synthetase